MAEIRCPMCGKPNPDDLAVCQFCQARLKPMRPASHPEELPLGSQPNSQDDQFQDSNGDQDWLHQMRLGSDLEDAPPPIQKPDHPWMK